MSIRVDSRVTSELAQYGGDTVTKCFNCGNCTAACSLTNQDSVFPRRYIRYIQMGLRGKMLGSVDPWMCYYCGDCSDTCPRDAEPGNLMMAGRRWLISMYDWTGLSRLMYKWPAWEVVLLLIVAVGVLALFTLPETFGFRLLAAHPEAQGSVDLARFAPVEAVHWGDLIMATVLVLLLLSNAARMTYHVMRNGPAVPFTAFLLELKEFVIHGLTQKRWRECKTDNTKHWLRHVALVSAYGTMFLLVVVFLTAFQVQDTSFHWTSLLGYYATLVLLGTTVWIASDRIRKKSQIHKHSDLADWLFIALLFLTSLSGILLHLFRLLDVAGATYVMYMVHLMIAVPMLVVEVPFGKWSHLLYRPLAVYLTAVQARSRVRATVPAAATPLPV